MAPRALGPDHQRPRVVDTASRVGLGVSVLAARVVRSWATSGGGRGGARSVFRDRRHRPAWQSWPAPGWTHVVDARAARVAGAVSAGAGLRSRVLVSVLLRAGGRFRSGRVADPGGARW